MRTTTTFIAVQARFLLTEQPPIELSIMINGKRCFINLPMKVSPEDFNRKRQPKFLADYLSGMRVTINQIINDMLAHQEPARG